MNIKNTLDTYLHFYPEEGTLFDLLTKQISQNEDMFSRKNFTGHITASAFIINESSKQVLLLEHRALKKFLQPGGHVDPEDSGSLSAAIREVEEETGLKVDELTLRSLAPNDRQIPFDIDTHEIPESKKKSEPAHCHHDFRYIFTTRNSDIEYDASESYSCKWVDWEDFHKIPNFNKISNKINDILSSNTRLFL